MSKMFCDSGAKGNAASIDKWKVNNTADIIFMFSGNKINGFIELLMNWDITKFINICDIQKAGSDCSHFTIYNWDISRSATLFIPTRDFNFGNIGYTMRQINDCHKTNQ